MERLRSEHMAGQGGAVPPFGCVYRLSGSLPGSVGAAQVGGEAGGAFGGEAAVFVGDAAADWRRVAAVGVFETGADTEFAGFVTAGHSAEQAGVAAFAFVVGGNGAFRVVRAFELEQVIAAAALVGDVGVAQHHAFAALGFDLAQELLGMGSIAHGGLRDNGDFGLRVGSEVALHEGEALIQVARGLRRVENVQLDAAPIAVGAADGGGNLLECAAPAVELAVERVGREIAGETGGRGEGVALAADEFVPVPIGTHAVEFFAHRPAGNVLAVVFFGQDKVGRGVQGGGEQEGGEDGEEWFHSRFCLDGSVEAT